MISAWSKRQFFAVLPIMPSRFEYLETFRSIKAKLKRSVSELQWFSSAKGCIGLQSCNPAFYMSVYIPVIVEEFTIQSLLRLLIFIYTGS